MADNQLQSLLEDWLKDRAIFEQFFLRTCRAMANAVGYDFTVDEAKLGVAYNNWVARCDFWAKERVPQPSNGLSHVKIMAILLNSLATSTWMASIQDKAPEDHTGRFKGKEDLRKETRDCMASGTGVFFAFHFVIKVLVAFEEARVDRDEKYQARLTPDLAHDLIVYLSGQPDELATFLILKALYARPGRNLN